MSLERSAARRSTAGPRPARSRPRCAAGRRCEARSRPRGPRPPSPRPGPDPRVRRATRRVRCPPRSSTNASCESGGLQRRPCVLGVLRRREALESHPVADPHLFARLAQPHGETEPPQPRGGLLGVRPREEGAGADAGEAGIVQREQVCGRPVATPPRPAPPATAGCWSAPVSLGVTRPDADGAGATQRAHAANSRLASNSSRNSVRNSRILRTTPIGA